MKLCETPSRNKASPRKMLRRKQLGYITLSTVIILWVGSVTKWRLNDTFEDGKYWKKANTWEEWDNLTPEERAEVEDRYEKNRNYQAASKLKKGTYAE